MMLIWLILLYSALAGSGQATAQEQKVFNGELILGANFTQVDGDSYYGYHKVGLNAGGIVCAHFSSKVGVSLELLYSQKGSRGVSVYESYAIGTYIEKYNMNLNYVEVPLMLHLFKGRYDYEAGISYAQLVKSSEWVQSDVPVVIDPVINRFNTTDLNYIIGLSRRMYKTLYLNARFQYSILSIRPTDRVPYSYSYGNLGQFNNLFNLRLVYYM